MPIDCVARSDVNAVTSTAITTIADFVSGVSPDAHPRAAIGRAKLAVLDTIGCMLLGAHADVTRVAIDAAAGWGDGDALVVGTGVRRPPPWAALANGAAAHSLDLDDFTFIANDHPSAVMLPALLAACAGREHDVPGRSLLDAYLVGLEVIFRLGEAVNMGHYNLGWHTTSTLDSLGATAAVCRLNKAGVNDTAAALALTVSMNAGFVSQFGTMGKPLHAGLAAKSALLAAGLGVAGATGYLGALDGAVSVASLMTRDGEARFNDAMAKLGNPWGIEEHGLGAKVYPSCGYTHRSVDAAIALKDALGIRHADEVAHVSASLPDFHLSVLPFQVPSSRNEALFSTAYCVATALVTGGNRIADFTNKAIAREDIRALAARVSVTARTPKRPALNFDPDDPDVVEIRLKDGRSARHAVPIYTGAPGRDLDRDAFVAKFRECCEQHGAERGQRGARVDAIIAAVDTLDTTPSLEALVTSLNV